MSGFTSTPFITQLATGGWPPATVSENLLVINLSGGNTLAVKNNAADGYSAFTARGSDGYEYTAYGYGNASSATIFAGRNYIETHSGKTGAADPKVFVFCADGNYGRTGTVGTFRFYQRWTVDADGMHWWKGTDYGNTQVKVATVHQGGYFGVLNNSVPNAIDILPGTCAFWYDKSAGAPFVNFRSRDVDGALYAGSVALSAVTPTASDTFTVGDSATEISGGRTADNGGAWASVDGDAWGVSSNKAYRSGGTQDSYAYLGSGLSDVCVECDITLSSVRASAGLVVRGVDANNMTYVQFQKNGTTDALMCFKKVSGTFTQIGVSITSMGFALGGTYAIKVGAVGNQIRVYVNGVDKATFEDSTHASATKQGFISYIGATDDDGGTRWDNFKVFP